MLARALEDDDVLTDEGGSDDSAEEPEYAFDGFTVEFSDKVMLTPIAAASSLANQQSRRRRAR